MDQIAVCRVQFDDVESGFERALRRVRERRDDTGDVSQGQRPRRRVGAGERFVRRPDRLPAAVLGCDFGAAVPRPRRARLSTRVRELNARQRFL